MNSIECKPYTLCCCNEQAWCQIDRSIVIPCISAVLFTGVCRWHCQSSECLPVLPSIFSSAPLPSLPLLFSLTNSSLHLPCNFVCQRQCQISQSACVLCHSQGHEDESAVSWCQSEGLGLQSDGGRTQRVQVGPQLTFTHYNTDTNLYIIYVCLFLSQPNLQTQHKHTCWKHLTLYFLQCHWPFRECLCQQYHITYFITL